jgi:hypothetical protein
MRITFVSFFLLFSFAVFSQNDNTSSPYSRYGYGQLADQTFAAQRGMGGIGYGLRSSQIINPLNPASFSSVDSMTFMLDFGLKWQTAWMNDGAYGRSRRFNAGLEYLALQISLGKGLGMGIGIEPVSFVGYQYGDTVRQYDNSIAYRIFNGSGGLSKIYSTLSYNFFNRLAAGVNVGYLFGQISHNATASYTTQGYTISWPDSLIIKNLTFEAGLQYTHKLTKSSAIVVGAVYSPKITSQATVKTAEITYDESTGQITGDPLYHSTRDSVYQMPEKFGIGATYSRKDKLTLGADFLFQRWAKAKFNNKTNTLSNRLKINVGGEYIPNIRGNSIFSRTHYRAGAYFADSYIIDSNNSTYNEIGLSVGLGIPINRITYDRSSFINLAFEYSRLAPKNPLSMSEQFFKLTLSYTYNDLWFFRRKLQ